VTLKWKTNVATSGTIHAAAGLGPVYSPTTLTAQIVSSGVSSLSSTKQYGLSGSNGSTWTAIDHGGALTMLMPVPANDETVLLSANADLWTENAGVNQDLAIFISADGAPSQLAAWKESGGSAGIFSPNAAFVQIAFRAQAGVLYTVTLEWKTNVPTTGTIHAGAGLGPYSPTSLTIEMLPGS
jgi:hypothetical protein